MAFEQLTRQSPLDGQADRQNRHQCLISHGINDGAHNGLQLPMSGDVSIDEVRDPRVRKQAEGPRMLIVQNEIPHDRSC